MARDPHPDATPSLTRFLARRAGRATGRAAGRLATRVVAAVGGVYAVLFGVRAVAAVPDVARTAAMLGGATVLGWAVVVALRRIGEWPGVRRALAVAVGLVWVVTGIRAVLL